MAKLCFAVLFIANQIFAQETQVPEKATCAVCALKGETEPEKVKAYSVFEGKSYYFCSQACRQEFDSDPVAYTPPVLPRPAPDFVVESLDGQDVRRQDFQDKVLFVDFWATWCKPCLETTPELQKLHDLYSDKGLTVLGISIDEDKNRIRKIEKFVKKHRITYQVASDAKKTPAWHIFKVKAIPAMFLIDRNGQIVRQWTGKINHQEVIREVSEVVKQIEQDQ